MKNKSNIDLVEQQREHFNKISNQYAESRDNPNLLLLKQLIWNEFLSHHKNLALKVYDVLEPMCGMAEGHGIIKQHLKSDFRYYGFDYSESMVKQAQVVNPQLTIGLGNVLTYQAPSVECHDLIILIGGLHHVFLHTDKVLINLGKALKPTGYFISYEPTHNNWLTRRIRNRIYQENAIFDHETEQGFEFVDLETKFRNAGFKKVDQVYPGLLSYVLYYNPDAFPWLNVGGQFLVRLSFWIDRLFWRRWIGQKLTFATLTLWQRM